MLHILNGDSLRVVFPEKLADADDIIIFREILSEGPVSTEISQQFWQNRARYLDAEVDYHEKVVGEWEAILQSQDDLTLWFEHDLICQINMIFILAQLHLRNKCLSRKVYLVTANSHVRVTRFKGLAQLHPPELYQLYEEKILLGDKEFDRALNVWSLYSGKNPVMLAEIIFEDPLNFKYLREALVAHLEKFPAVQNGLSRLEQKLLSYINTGVQDRNKLEKLMIESDTVYGLTDFGFKKLITGLKPLFEDFEKLKLSKTGIEVLNGDKNYVSIGRPVTTLGAVSSDSFQWDRVSKQLYPRLS